MTHKLTCNLCGKRKFIIVHSQVKTDILRCQNCSLVFRDPIPAKKEIEKIYNQKKYLDNKYFIGLKNGYSLNHPVVKLYQKELNRINNILTSGNILDIGCAYGVFLDLAKKMGWNPQGIEISKKSSQYARKYFNLPIFTGTLKQANLKSDNFNLITMWDVIEHLSDPTSDLKKIYRLLKKDGIIMILTVNFDSLMGRMANLSNKTKSYLYDIQHNYFFTFSTLQKMLKKNGFKKIQQIDSLEAQIYRWQSRKIPSYLIYGTRFVDFLSSMLGGKYRQVVIAHK